MGWDAAPSGFPQRGLHATCGSQAVAGPCQSHCCVCYRREDVGVEVVIKLNEFNLEVCPLFLDYVFPIIGG